MAPHCSTLAWKILWMEETGRLQSTGLQSWTRLSNFTFTFHFHALGREMATHSSVLAWRIPGTGEPGGLPSMGLHRVGHYWSDLAAAATFHTGLPWWLSGKEPACQCRRHRFNPWIGKILSVLLPGKSHGQRSLAGYSPWGCKNSQTWLRN